MSASKEQRSVSENRTAAPHKVIIDSDTGADDASALILAAKSKNIEILGATVLVGNVDLEQSTQNALTALEIAGCGAPVYKGSAERYAGKKIEAFSVFGSDGMGDADLIHPTGKAQDKDAIDFILETVDKYPGEVEIVALGPATNVARAIERDPETMKKVKTIWSMGTAGLGPGNASPVAEFNVYGDAEAYKVMLDSGIPVTIVGLDMCGGAAMWTDADFEELEKTNGIGRFVSASFSKIREFYASNGSAGAVMNCDAVAMMCVTDPDFIRETIPCHGSCITDRGETYGQVIFYRKGFTYDVVKNDFDYNVTLVGDVKKEEYFRRFLKAIRS
jgi:purine nucleosidase